MADEEEKPEGPEARPELDDKWPGYNFMVYQGNIIGSTRDIYGRPMFTSEEIDEEGEEFWAEVIVRKLIAKAHEARLIRNGKGRVTGMVMSFEPSELPVEGANREQRRWQKRLDKAENRRNLRHSSSYYGRRLQSKTDKKGNKE